jgi:uncharacterized membrane protein YkoI
MKRKLTAALALAAAAAIGGAAYANQSNEENDALALASAKIDLIQAVTAAEQQTGGKAAKAELEHSKSGWVFDVEVVKDGKVYDVAVDASSGNVLSATEDTADHEDEDDKD